MLTTNEMGSKLNNSLNGFEIDTLWTSVLELQLDEKAGIFDSCNSADQAPDVWRNCELNSTWDSQSNQSLKAVSRQIDGIFRIYSRLSKYVSWMGTHCSCSWQGIGPPSLFVG
jgi:hypothetical protein